MNKQTTILVIVFFLMVTPLTVSVSGATERRLTVKIPFDFIAGNKRLPAGLYTIGPTPSSGVLKIHCAEKSVGIGVNTMIIDSKQTLRRSKLVFRRYWDQYYLAYIWTEGMDYGRELMISPQERTLLDEAKYLTGHEIEPVIVTVTVTAD